MKKVLFISIILLSLQTFSQTGSLYGIRMSTSTYASQLIKINPVTAAITVVSPSNFGNGLVFGVSTLNPTNKIFYFLTPGDTLYSIDILSGNVLSHVKLSTAGTYSAPILEFNAFDNTLYGVSHKFSNNTHYLSKINPSTGSVTILSTTGFSSPSAIAGSTSTPQYLMNSTIDPINNLFYINSEYFYDTLYAFNLSTGNIQLRKKLSSSFTFSAPSYYQAMIEFNCSDTSLYAIVKYSGNNMTYLSKVNPATGSVTVISSTGISNNFFVGSTLDPVTKRFFITSVPDTIYSTSLVTGNLVNKNKMFNNGYYNPVFEYEKLCLGNPTGVKQFADEDIYLNLYPNPNNGTFNVEIDKSSTELMIINAIGQHVYTQKLNEGLNTVYTHQLAKGLYYYTIIQKNNKLGYSKLLIE
ncbi:MAG: T9SS type A sorting domain-containing protein [Bacteroidetes bacterium]|nr:T9SS type A sorting domain-containing protein [Bacteroidota bacterium]